MHVLISYSTKPIISYLLNGLNIWRVERQRHKQAAGKNEENFSGTGKKSTWARWNILALTEFAQKAHKIDNKW